MRRATPPGSTLVVKVGSSSLTSAGVGIDDGALDRVVSQVQGAMELGHPTVLVTSGAVAAGLPALGIARRPNDVGALQAAAAVGQGRLMERYSARFAALGIVAGQVLLTKSVLGDREQYLHARSAFDWMLARRIVPIVNENDTVAIEELRIGDNDRLAALVSHLVAAGLLVILTDTKGIHADDPRSNGGAELLTAVRHTDEILDRLARGSAGPLGSGGIGTKIAAARMAAWSGVPTVIADANDADAVRHALAGGDVGTWIDPRPERLPARKLWIAFGQPAEGRLTIDDGAVTALVGRGSSLLTVGLVSVSGVFNEGAAVEVYTTGSELVAKGVVRMDSATLGEMAGRKAEDGREAIHRDDLVVLAR